MKVPAIQLVWDSRVTRVRLGNAEMSHGRIWRYSNGEAHLYDARGPGPPVARLTESQLMPVLDGGGWRITGLSPDGQPVEWVTEHVPDSRRGGP